MLWIRIGFNAAPDSRIDAAPDPVTGQTFKYVIGLKKHLTRYKILFWKEENQVNWSIYMFWIRIYIPNTEHADPWGYGTTTLVKLSKYSMYINIQKSFSLVNIFWYLLVMMKKVCRIRTGTNVDPDRAI